MINFGNNPWFVVVDTETTKVKDGEVVEIGAIWVNSKTLVEIASERYFLSKPIKALTSEPGDKHYQKVREQCESALPREYVLDKFLKDLRGPLQYDVPVIVGYCSRINDLPILRRMCDGPDHWLCHCRDIDVAIDYAYKMFPSKEDDPDAEPRKLENVARQLGIAVDKSSLHNPLYDCRLTLQVLIELDKRLSSNQVIVTKKSVTPIIQDPQTQEAINWARSRAYNPKYARITCPKCSGVMHSSKPRECNIKSADSFFYACESCSWKMNIDGTKGQGKKRIRYCDIEDCLLSEWRDA